MIRKIIHIDEDKCNGCGLLLSARETPTTGIASSSKSKGFGLLFFFCSVSYTLVFSGKMRNHFQLLTR